MKCKEYSQPWEAISADIMGPYPLSKNGLKYLLVIHDEFTKFVVCRPLRTATGPKIWQALNESVFSVFGFCKSDLTDNGTEFANLFLTKAFKERGIKQVFAPPYHAQINNSERINRTLKIMIRIFLKGDHRLWDEHVSEFAFAINNAVQQSTKFSPYFLNFGRHPRPNSLVRVESPNKKIIFSQVDWADRMSRLEAYHDLIKRHLTVASLNQAKYYNRGRRDIQFKEGDLVMRKEHHLSSANKKFAGKLASPFSGPHPIEKVVSPQVYELKKESGKKMGTTHIRYLKKFHGENISGMAENSRYWFAKSSRSVFDELDRRMKKRRL